MVRYVGQGPSSLMFAHDGKIQEIARIPASEIFDAGKDSHGRFWFSTSAGLWVYDGGKAARTTDRVWKPVNILVSKDFVFVWSEDGKILYRVNTESETVEAIDLRSVGFGDVYVRRDFVRSFAIENETTFCFGFGPDVVELSLAHAQWRRVA